MSYVLGFDGVGAPILLDAETLAPAPDPPAEADASAGSVARRRDAVVDASRTLDDLSSAGVESFVRRRWRGDRAIAQEDIDSFSKDAIQQRTHDVVDALDHRIRRGVNGRTKATHVSIPRGNIGKSLASLEGERITEVVSRLRDRGWTNEQIWRHGLRRFDRDKRIRGVVFGKTDPKVEG